MEIAVSLLWLSFIQCVIIYILSPYDPLSKWWI